MLQGRYPKVVLTVIAVALPVLATAQLDAPWAASAGELDGDAEVDRAPTQQPARQEQLREEPPADASGTRAPEITLPMRWRVAAAVEHTTGDTFCTTIVDVTNATEATVSVEVEWHDDLLGSLAVASSNVPAFDQHTFVADDDVRHLPWLSIGGGNADLADFDGYALVAADDPRIFVHAAILCRDGLESTAKMVALYGSPVFPVGATADYFRAGVPGVAPMPPTAAATQPES